MDTDVLTRLIDTKLKLLTELRLLASRQRELLASSDMARIMNYLAAKQRLLNAIEEVERRLDPFRSQDPDQRVWRSPADRARTREASEQCATLLREIIELEQQGEAALAQQRHQAVEHLRGFHQSRQVSHAYLGFPEAAGHQFDASCDT